MIYVSASSYVGSHMPTEVDWTRKGDGARLLRLLEGGHASEARALALTFVQRRARNVGSRVFLALM